MECPNCGSTVFFCPTCKMYFTPRLAQFQNERIRTWVSDRVFRAETLYEKRVLIDLSLVAMKHDERFLSFRPADGFGYGLVVDTKPFGYIVWNYFEQSDLGVRRAKRILRNKTPVLRQFFVMPQFHRNGFGKLLFDASIADLGVDLKSLWLVDAPSEEMLGFLVKYGYAQKIETEIVGKNVKFLKPSV